MTKPLKSLVSSLKKSKVEGREDRQVAGIAEDSRKAKKDFLFVAIKGENFDGHDYIAEAVENGATVVVGEKDKETLSLEEDTTYIKVKDSREALGILASSWYDNPSEKLIKCFVKSKINYLMNNT